MVQVKVTEGILEGEKVVNPYGGEFYSFKGIPYAEPPLGDLRFKAPKHKESWDGVRKATTCGSPSLQLAIFAQPITVIGSEDCLYLNVYTPEVNPKKTLPVMVWIHGGAFQAGSGGDDLYSPNFLVKENVIVVTINYRLDILGFLCLDTEDIPGNAGMKDQVAALRWINKNIGYFGGDPKNVTIFGESAGSMSVCNLMASPVTKGLFRRVIAQSGTSLTPGNNTFLARERGLALAKHLGCQSDNDKEIYEFFKSTPAEKLIACPIHLTFLEANRKIIDIFFGPVVEKKFDSVEPFLCKDVCEAIKERDDKPEILLGYTEHEGALFLLYNEDVKPLPERLNTYKEMFLPRMLVPVTTLDAQFEIAKRVREFYFNKENVTAQNLFKIIEYFGFETFGFPTIAWANICVNKPNSNVYLYKFSCKTERNVSNKLITPDTKHMFGGLELTSHGDDLHYIFPSENVFQDSKIADTALKCIDNVLKLWTNFAKFGNPTPDNSFGVKWKPYHSKEKNYLDIGNKLTPGVDVDKDEVEFWENLIRQYGKQVQKYRLGLLNFN